MCMRDGKNVWCDCLVAIHGCRSVNLQQICLRTCYHSIRHFSFENQRERLLDRCLSIRHANLNCETLVGKIIATLSMQDTCLLVQWDSMAMSLQLQQICLLAYCNFHKHRCCSNMPTSWVMCKMGACWTVATQSICLPIFYHSFLHACWCCSSLSAIPVCMVSHYQPFLLVWSLIICHAFWCDVSLSAMPSGVLSHHRPRLLVWSLIINHAYWCGVSL